MVVTQVLNEQDLLEKQIVDKNAKVSFGDIIGPNEDKILAKKNFKEEQAKETGKSVKVILYNNGYTIEDIQQIMGGSSV